MAPHTATDARKYLAASEYDAFLREADVADRQVRTLCRAGSFGHWPSRVG